MIKLIRKRGGRSYVYREGTPVPDGWAIQDEDGKTYSTQEEYEASLKPTPKEKEAPKKKATSKKV